MKRRQMILKLKMRQKRKALKNLLKRKQPRSQLNNNKSCKPHWFTALFIMISWLLMYRRDLSLPTVSQHQYDRSDHTLLSVCRLDDVSLTSG